MKMVADRKPAVESLQETGREVLKTADDDKKPEIEVGLADINSQWVDLNELVEARQKQLDDALEASQKFDDLYKEARKKLSEAETQLKDDEFDAAKASPEDVKEQLDKLEVSYL
jgi:exonuclease VII small subunit